MAFRLSDDADDLTEAHEINVTPFIDVMLVLLIIFMVAAPLSTVDLAVTLPASQARQLPRPDEPIYLTLTADLALHVGEERVAPQSLKSKLDAAAKGDPAARIFVRADRVVAYGELMGVLDQVRAAGYRHIALVGVEQP